MLSTNLLFIESSVGGPLLQLNSKWLKHSKGSEHKLYLVREEANVMSQEIEKLQRANHGYCQASTVKWLNKE